MNRRPSRKAGCAGFSLVEVVVAFAVAALALGVLYQIFSSAARQAILVQHYGRALAVADARLTEAGIAEQLASSAQAGETDDRFRWRRTVEPYLPGEELAPASAVLSPYRVTVEVRWSHDGGERAIALSTVRLGPRS